MYIYSGNEYADNLCLTNPRVWRKDEIACATNISKMWWKPHTGLTIYSFLVRDATSMMYEDTLSAHYPKSLRVDTATHSQWYRPWGNLLFVCMTLRIKLYCIALYMLVHTVYIYIYMCESNSAELQINLFSIGISIIYIGTIKLFSLYVIFLRIILITWLNL